MRARVEEALGAAPVEVDELIRQTGAAPAVVLTVILELELAGRLPPSSRKPGLLGRSAGQSDRQIRWPIVPNLKNFRVGLVPNFAFGQVEDRVTGVFRRMFGSVGKYNL